MMLQVTAKGAGSAEVLIYDVIGDPWDGTTAKQFAADIKALGSLRDLTIRINSPGGNVFDGLAIYNTIRGIRASKRVHVDGIAASIASVIAMAGDSIVMGVGAQMMIHDAWTMAYGDAEAMRNTAEILERTSAELATIYAGRTGRTADEMRAMMRAETWMSGEEAVGAGLATSVESNALPQALAPITIMNCLDPARLPPRVRQHLDASGRLDVAAMVAASHPRHQGDGQSTRSSPASPAALLAARERLATLKR